MDRSLASPPVEQAAKIRAETDKQVSAILSAAYRDAERIKGEGDAEAARIYAEAYSKDAEFYKLTRTLESYKKFLDEKTTVVLSSNSELLKLLTQGRPLELRKELLIEGTPHGAGQANPGK